MYTASDLRKGLKVVIDNDPYVVTFLNFQSRVKDRRSTERN
jgi:translation elongation factor P/translation initiation factor 5A